MRILLIEDEFGIGDGVRAYLARMGRRVDWVRSFREGSSALMTQNYDILLVDLRLPDGDGLELVSQLRDAGDQRPIIIISAQDQIRDRIKGLNAGADDYIVKPFNLGEMEARIHAVERRAFGNPSPKLTIGDVAIDATNRRVWVNGEELFLTRSGILPAVFGRPVHEPFWDNSELRADVELLKEHSACHCNGRDRSPPVLCFWQRCGGQASCACGDYKLEP